MGVKPQAIELHIEELVLDGFARRDRLSIADAVERELTRLIAEQGVESLHQPAAVDRVSAGAVRVARESRGSVVGAEVAMAVFRGISSPGPGGAKR